MGSAAYETNYRCDRRNHKHRCHCCARIITPGERVIMAKVDGRKTWAIHAECGERQHGSSASTWRDAMNGWATEHQRRTGR